MDGTTQTNRRKEENVSVVETQQHKRRKEEGVRWLRHSSTQKTESKAHEYRIREKSKQEREEYVRGSARE